MAMMTNVGVIDRALRLLVGFGLLGWAWDYYGTPLPDAAEWAVTVIGAYPAITGLLRYDPAFAVAGISTCAEE
jgi:hypothetical protein